MTLNVKEESIMKEIVKSHRTFAFTIYSLIFIVLVIHSKFYYDL